MNALFTILTEKDSEQLRLKSAQGGTTNLKFTNRRLSSAFDSDYSTVLTAMSVVPGF